MSVAGSAEDGLNVWASSTGLATPCRRAARSGAMTPMQVTDNVPNHGNGGYSTTHYAAIRCGLTLRVSVRPYPFEAQQRFDPATMYALQEGCPRVFWLRDGALGYNQVPVKYIRLAGKTGNYHDLREQLVCRFFRNDLVAVSWLGQGMITDATRLTGASGALQGVECL